MIGTVSVIVTAATVPLTASVTTTNAPRCISGTPSLSEPSSTTTLPRLPRSRAGRFDVDSNDRILRWRDRISETEGDEEQPGHMNDANSEAETDGSSGGRAFEWGFCWLLYSPAKTSGTEGEAGGIARAYRLSVAGESANAFSLGGDRSASCRVCEYPDRSNHESPRNVS